MSVPKVSVVIPIYNVEQYLRECLDSVINQTLKDIEIICMNDGSTDNSAFILKEYADKDPRIKVINKQNTGYGHNMNVGLDTATGEYVGIVESDDFVHPEMFEVLYEAAKQNDLDFVKADFTRFYGEGEGRTIEKDSITHGKPLYWKVLNPSEDPSLLDCSLYTWAGIYKRQFLDENHIRHNETPGASYQDNGFWFQTFCLGNRMMFVDRTFYNLRRDNPNSSFLSKAKVFCVCDEYDFIFQFLDRHPEIKEKFISKYYRIKYGTYMFTYRRVAPEFKMVFLRRMSVEFYTARSEGQLDRSAFTSSQWTQLNRIIDSPEDVFAEEGITTGLLTRKQLENRLLRAESDLEAIRESLSFRIGNAITFLPRIIRRGFWSLKENGFFYTWRKLLSKI